MLQWLPARTLRCCSMCWGSKLKSSHNRKLNKSVSDTHTCIQMYTHTQPRTAKLTRYATIV